MRDRLKDWLDTYSPILKAAALIGLVLLCAIFLTDWSGATGWFLFVLLGFAGSAIYLGFKIYEVCAIRYVEGTYRSALKEPKEPSYKTKMRRLKKQRRRAIKGIYEHRSYSSSRSQWETYLTKVENQILDLENE